MNEYKIYLIRQKETGKIFYVGLTRQPLWKRWSQHKEKKKITDQKFGIELVQENLSLEQAAILEKLLIAQYNLLSEGWNISPGSINGYSNCHSEEMKAKWRKERKNKPVSKEHAAKNKRARLGMKNSEAHKKALIESRKRPVLCIDTGEVFGSAREAAKALKVSYSKISLCCNGKRKSTRNLKFRFV